MPFILGLTNSYLKQWETINDHPTVVQWNNKVLMGAV